MLADKGHPELAISVVKNSVAQVAAFLFPLLVLVSLLTATTLTFALAPVYTGALFGHGGDRLADHRRRGGDAVRGRGADRGLRDPGHGGRVRVAPGAFRRASSAPRQRFRSPHAPRLGARRRRVTWAPRRAGDASPALFPPATASQGMHFRYNA